MGFGQGLSGLNAASQNLDVIGNNIANSGTVGFKAGSASFADVYASSRVGLGVKVAAINQRFTTGTVATTGGEFDIAIDGANGFFRMLDPSGSVAYTRNGEFFMDKNFNIVNAQGMQLTGYPAGAIGAAPIGLRVPQANIPPLATSSAGVQTNLDADAAVIPGTDVPATPETLGVLNFDAADGAGAADHAFRIAEDGTIRFLDGTGAVDTGINGSFTVGGNTFTVTNGTVSAGGIPDPDTAYVAPVDAVTAVAFDPTRRTTYTDSVPTTVYDSLGNSHTLMQYFIKREANVDGESVYEVHYTLDGSPVQTAGGNNFSTLTFNASGQLLNAPPEVDLAIPNPGGVNSPAEDMAITMSYDGVTQFGNAFNPKVTPDGYASGQYLGISIAQDGSVEAQYSNGESQVVGTIALASFNNQQGLQPVGDNAWVETNASGQPQLGQPGTGGLASLRGQALEQSNVNLSDELVNMIVAQRTYQANSQTISTQSEILQTLLNIR